MFSKKNKTDFQVVMEETKRILSSVENGVYQVSLNADVMPDDLKKATEHINSVLDIKGRHIQDLQSKFDLITTSLNVGVWDMDMVNGQPDGTNRYSDAMRKMLGYTNTEDFPERVDSWTNNIYAEDAERVLGAFMANVNDKTGRTPFDCTYRMSLKDGSVRWFRATGSTLRGEDGIALRNVGAMFDVHDEKMMNEKLVNSDVRFDMINQALAMSGKDSEGPWYMKLTGDLTRETEIWYSYQFRKLLGYDDEKDFPGYFNSLVKGVLEGERKEIEEDFRNHIYDYSGKTELNSKFRAKTKDGEVRWFSILGHTFRDKQGNPLQVAGTIRDITVMVEKEAIEQELTSEMDEFTNSVVRLSKGVGDVSSQAKQLFDAHEGAIQSVELAKKSVDRSKNVTELIKNISEQLNLLGLNAAIEAARVGEAGKGFGVVAEEVRKLSTNTSEAIGDIEEIMSEINRSVQETLKSVELMNEMVKSQATTTEELDSSSVSITKQSNNLLSTIHKM